MIHLGEYIVESIEYNDKGYSNFFATAEDFKEALKTDNEIINNIFSKNAKNEDIINFIESIYQEQTYNFKTAPLVFKLDGHVKLKRMYENTDLHDIYKKQKVLRYKFDIGDGSLKGETEGNAYEYIFVEDSKEYISWLISDKKLECPLIIDEKKKSEKILLDNLFNYAKIDNKKLSEYIKKNKDKIDPEKVVFHTAKQATNRNKNGQLIKFENGKLKHIDFNLLPESGNIIADVQYKFTNDNKDYDHIINISLKDKKYQLSNLGMSDKTMNIYPLFTEDINNKDNENFKAFCEKIGIDYNQIYDNVVNKESSEDLTNISIKDNGDNYKFLSNLFRVAIGSNYYMVNSNGDIHYIDNSDSENSNKLKIKNVTVDYPSKSRKRVNINITFDSNPIVSISSIQMAIRSKSGDSGNYGFVACQLVWGNIKSK